MLNIELPTKKIDFHIQDANGNPVSNVGLKTFVEGSVFNESQLSIGGGITNARGRLVAYGTYNPEPTTDSSGNVTLWLFPNSSGKSYTITATPPSGNNNLTTTTFPNLVVTGDAQQTITMQQPVTLNGHVYGPQGNPLVNQTVYLQTSGGERTTATTDSSGNYSLQVAPGTYILDISSYNGAANHPPVNTPQYYELKKNNYSLTQDTTLDITVPAKKVDLHVKDPQGNAVSNASIQATHPCGWGCLSNVDGLSIGGNITDARGESLYGYIDPSPTTDASGDVTLWLLPNNSDKSYNFIATPPNGTDFTATTLSNIVVTNDTQQTITLQQPVTLSGHVYGPLGNALPNQTVSLGTTTTTTDANGSYSLQISTGTYVLKIDSQNNAFSLNVPQYYELQVNSYSLTQNTTLDITVPANRVNVHVQDTNGNAVNNVSIQTGLGLLANVDGLSIGGGITNARGKVVYGTYSTPPTTDASGDVTLWLFPNNFDKSYDIAATSPSGSIFNQFTLNDVVVTGDQNELISLQYNHATPITTALLATENPDGTYASPTTVTLTASAAAGYTVANSYYKVDGGTQQSYTNPFTITGDGEHMIQYWSVDNSGVQEAHKTKTFTIYVNQAPHVNPLSAVTIDEGDTYTASGSFTDADSTSWTATVDYGEGTEPNPEPLTLNPDKTFSLSHQYTTPGTYPVTVVVRDDGQSTGTTMATITVNRIQPTTLTAAADSYLKQGSANENEGASTFLRVQSSGHNRSLVRFDESQLENAVENRQSYTATLQFTITDNGGNWGSTGRTIDLHRLTSNWAEGNGFVTGNIPPTRGTGSGATWNCAIDTNIANINDDCSGATDWNMANSSLWPFAATVIGTQTITNNQTGVVEFDVTADVQAFINNTNQNYGWLVKKTNESQSGSVSFGSKESSNTAKLIISSN